MVKHKIFIYKSPKTTDRIGFIISIGEEESYEELPTELVKLCEDYNIVVHRLFTEDESVESIIELDPFFENVEFHRDITRFSDRIKQINKKSLPTPVEFSKVLLNRMPLDKLQLQKILYLVYSICLEQGKKIFNESPVAYQYGPVFEDVYQEYKHTESKEVIPGELSINQRLLLSKSLNDNELLPMVEEILNTVKNKSGSNLINVTHASGGPWKQVYIKGANNVIDDDTILKYNHKVRELIF